jgi:ATP-binding cassette subfamily B protein RaxB
MMAVRWLHCLRSGWRQLPMIYQSVNSECALACAAMLSCYWGAKTDIHAVRSVVGGATFGLTFKQLRQLLARLGMQPRVVQVAPDSLGRVRCPAILHWGLSHFVVLKKATRHHVYIHDPDRGSLRLTRREVGRKLSGWAIEARPAAGFRTGDRRTRIPWASLFSFRAKWAAGLAMAFVFALLSQLIVVTLPYLFQLTVDRILPRVELGMLSGVCGVFAALAMLDWIARNAQLYLSSTIGLAISRAMADGMFGHLMRVPLRYFEGRSISDICSRFDSLDEIRRAIIVDVPAGLVSLSLLTLCLLALVRFPGPLVACTLGTAAVYLGVRGLMFRHQRRLLAESHHLRGREQATLHETLSSFSSVKAFGAEQSQRARWSACLQEASFASLRLNFSLARLDHAKELLFALEMILSLYLAVGLILSLSMSVGMLLAYVAYKRLLLSSLMTMTELAVKAGAAGVHLQRLADMAAEQAEAEHRSGTVLGTVHTIELREVTFTYPGSSVSVVTAFAAIIRAGDRVALVGQSGAGKSTLIKLLLGLLAPQAGAIHINGQALADYDRHAWLRKVGVVFQGDKLMAGSLLDNLSFFAEAPDRDRARWAATVACAWELIEALPMGLETPVQDDFASLSAGQKQRLLIARALYRRPEVLIMDEGTANLDEPLEQEILHNIAALGITVIHATHRRQVIDEASVVLRMDGSKGAEAERAPF